MSFEHLSVFVPCRLWLAFVVYLPLCLAVSSLQVDTTVGKAYGFINGTHPNVAQFLGVPYAGPPVGDQRWEPSVVKTPVAKIDATRFGPSCPQYDTSIPSTYEIDAREFLISGPTSEDCLSLSIWAPFSAYHNDSLPVIVWYYGGGQKTGGAQIEYQIPTPWVERTQAHIVVQVNYRLNVFGNPKARGMDRPLNLGLLDQRMGLEWVQTNIANFGGDPSKITIWGQSAGASSVDYLNFAYPDNPIVHGIIMDSSSSLSNSGSATSIGDSFTNLAGHFGCGNLSATNEFNCMKKIDQLRIEAFLKKYEDAGTEPSFSFGPMADNVTVFANYTERFISGNFSKVPAIHGTNNNEGSSLTVWVKNGTTYNESLANANTVARACAAQKNLYYRYLQNATSYQYYYTGNWSNISPRFWEGAYHSSELPMIFGTHEEFRTPSTAFEYAVSHRMQDLWLAFMKDPVNGPRDQGWPVYEPSGQALEFAHDGKVEQLFDATRLEDNCSSNFTAIPGKSPPDNPNVGS